MTDLDLGTLVATMRMDDAQFAKAAQAAIKTSADVENRVTKALTGLRITADDAKFTATLKDATSAATTTGGKVEASLAKLSMSLDDKAFTAALKAAPDTATSAAKKVADTFTLIDRAADSTGDKIKASSDRNAKSMEGTETAARQAAKAQADYQKALDQIAGTLDKSTGAVTANTRAWAANKIGADYLRNLEQAGVSTRKYLDAVTGVPGALASVRSSLAGNESALAQLEAATNRVTQAQGDFVTRQRAVGDASETASAATRDAAKTTDNAGDAARNVTPLIGGMSNAFESARNTMIAFFAADKFVDFIRDSVRAASDLQQAGGSIEAVFGSMTDGINKFAKTSVDGVGLASSQYQELAAKFGASLKGMGVSSEELAPLTNKLITLGADLAAQFGGTTSDAVAALGSLMAGEAEPVKRFGVTIKDADVQARLAAEGLDKLEGAGATQARTQAILALLFEKTADSAGMFTSEQDTLAVKQQKANAKFEEAKAAIGDRLMPVWIKFVDMLSDKGVPALESVGEIFSVILAVIGPAVEGFASLNAPMMALVGVAALLTVGVVKFTTAAFAANAASVAAGTGALTMKAAMLSAAGATTTMGLAAKGALAVLGGPIGVAIVGVTAVLSLMSIGNDDTAESVDGLTDAIDRQTGKLKESAARTITDEAAKSGASAAYKALGGNVGDYIDALGGVPGKQEIVNKTIADARARYEEMRDALKEAAAGVGDFGAGLGAVADSTGKLPPSIYDVTKASDFLNAGLEQMGLTTDEVAIANEGLTGELGGATTAIDSTAEAASLAADPLKAMGAAFDKAAEQAQILADNTEAQRMLDEIDTTASDAARALDIFGAEIDKITGRDVPFEEALLDWNDGIRSMRDAWQDAAEAGGVNRQALLDWNVAALGTTEAGSNIAKSMSAVAADYLVATQSAYSHELAIGDSTTAQNAARQAADDLRAAFIKENAEMVGGTENAGILADKLGILAGVDLPDKSFDIVATDQQARDALANAEAAKINNKNFFITADAANAQAQANNLNTTLNTIDNKTVRWFAIGNVVVSVSKEQADNANANAKAHGYAPTDYGTGATGGNVGDLLGFAAGGKVDKDGKITGPGGPTDDLVLADGPDGRKLRLSNEETIVNGKASKKWGATLAAMNADRFATGGTIGGAPSGDLVQGTLQQMLDVLRQVAHNTDSAPATGTAPSGTSGGSSVVLDTAKAVEANEAVVVSVVDARKAEMDRAKELAKLQLATAKTAIETMKAADTYKLTDKYVTEHNMTMNEYIVKMLESGSATQLLDLGLTDITARYREQAAAMGEAAPQTADQTKAMQALTRTTYDQAETQLKAAGTYHDAMVAADALGLTVGEYVTQITTSNDVTALQALGLTDVAKANTDAKDKILGTTKAGADLAAQFTDGNTPAAADLTVGLGAVDAVTIDNKLFDTTNNDAQAVESLAVIEETQPEDKSLDTEVKDYATPVLEAITGYTIPDKVINVQAPDMAQLQIDLANIRQAIATMPDLNITSARIESGELVYTTTTGAKMKAKGGPIVGPGTGTSDDVPIMASNGEWVVPAKQTAENIGWLKSITPGYAAGGMVGGPKGSGTTGMGMGMSVSGEVAIPDADVMGAAWDDIAKAVADAVTSGILPSLDTLGESTTTAGDGFTALRDDVTVPAFTGITDAITAAQAAIDPVFNEINTGSTLVGSTFRALLDTQATPAWSAIGSTIRTTHKGIIAPTYATLNTGSDEVGKAFGVLNTATGKEWSGIGTAVKSATDDTVLPAFTRVGDGSVGVSTKLGELAAAASTRMGEVGAAAATSIDNVAVPAFGRLNESAGSMQAAFSDAATGISSAWSSIKAGTAEPVNWVLDSVWNQGVLPAWEQIKGWLPSISTSLGALTPIGYATGGKVEGPGTGTSDSILARLSAGEWVVPAAQVGPNLDLLKDITPGYASGGLVGAWGGIDSVSAGLAEMGDTEPLPTDVTSFVKGFVKNPLGTITGMIGDPLGQVDQQNRTPWGSSSVAQSGNAVGGIIGTLKDMFGLQNDGKGGAPKLEGGTIAMDGALFVDGDAYAMPADQTRRKFLESTASKMGTEYVWGADGPNVFDCSGLMSWALREAGAMSGRLTAEGFNTAYPHVGGAGNPADLATFDTGRIPGKAGHIGAILDVGKGLMMHTDGAGPARVGDYKSRDGGPLSIVDAIGGSANMAKMENVSELQAQIARIIWGDYSTAASGVGILNPDDVKGMIGAETRGLNTLNPIADFGPMNMLRGTPEMAGALPPGNPVDRWAPMYAQIMEEKGIYSPANLAAALLQTRTESGGSPIAINLSDSNARRGRPSKGQLQTIPTTFAAYADPGFDTNIYNPQSNARAAFNYGPARYGSIQGAFRGVAYDQGGAMPPGIGMFGNFSGQTEEVLTGPERKAWVKQVREGDQGPAIDYGKLGKALADAMTKTAAAPINVSMALDGRPFREMSVSAASGRMAEQSRINRINGG